MEIKSHISKKKLENLPVEEVDQAEKKLVLLGQMMSASGLYCAVH